MRVDDSPQRWLSFRRRRPGARLRLFCLPYAGGGASTYRRWQAVMPPDVEVCAVQPPGRENRIREAPFASAADLVAALDTALEPLTDLPLALFGYSMGATVAFEWAHHLRQRRDREPRLLIVAARAAPQVRRPAGPTHHLPDAAFKRRLRELAGTPPEVLANEEMMDLLLPLRRADFRVNDTYRPRRREPLACPLIAFGGLDDVEVAPAHLEQWGALTRGSFRLHLLPGDHFGLLRGEALVRAVASACRAVTG
jgi:medium-chain acyl-[acyl-carrier-protein] hydrolase